jgi:hypothetical protein
LLPHWVCGVHVLWFGMVLKRPDMQGAQTRSTVAESMFEFETNVPAAHELQGTQAVAGSGGMSLSHVPISHGPPLVFPGQCQPAGHCSHVGGVIGAAGIGRRPGRQPLATQPFGPTFDIVGSGLLPTGQSAHWRFAEAVPCAET